MIPVKPSTKLPSKTALSTLLKSKMTSNDYAKATPLTLGPALQALRKKEK